MRRIAIEGLLLLALAVSAFSTQAGQTSYFIYDESGHVIGEYAADGTPIQEHVYLGDRPVAVVQNGSSTGGTVSYVSTDQLDTPRVITDGSGTAVWRWNSDPFGNGTPTGTGLIYNLRFPGQYYDAETGHNYNMNRDYDSTTGRYVESDPIGLESGVNSFVYVNGSPLSLGDPNGEDPAGAVIGRQIGGWVAGFAGAETGPFDGAIVLGGEALGGVIGDKLGDWVISESYVNNPEAKAEWDAYQGAI